MQQCGFTERREGAPLSFWCRLGRRFRFVSHEYDVDGGVPVQHPSVDKDRNRCLSCFRPRGTAMLEVRGIYCLMLGHHACPTRQILSRLASGTF